jgi:hypothetical protein
MGNYSPLPESLAFGGNGKASLAEVPQSGTKAGEVSPLIFGKPRDLSRGGFNFLVLCIVRYYTQEFVFSQLFCPDSMKITYQNILRLNQVDVSVSLNIAI